MNSKRYFIASYFTLFALFLTINWHVISSATYEVSDFAANSLLIQDAKELNLLVGNYSRLGFNHPGPAILYVLAVGEYVFYDLLAIVNSPFSGQLIAVVAYNVFWIILIAALFRELLNNILDAAAATAIFSCFSLLFDYQFLFGIWFPHLYYFPFGVFMLSLAGASQGRAPFFIPLVISAGFLVNGHVSFIVIIGIMVVGGIIYNQLVSKLFRMRAGAFNDVLKKNYFSKERIRITFAAIVFVTFFLPLLIETARKYPGPMAKYLSYPSANGIHSILESLVYVGNYWGNGVISLAMGMLFTLLLIFSTKKETSYQGESLLIVVLLSTIASIVYAKIGIDDLSYKYLMLFYYAAPAFILTIFCIQISRQFSATSKKVYLLGLIAFSSLIMIHQARREPGYFAHYKDVSIAELAKKMSTIDGLPLVLELDETHDWGYVWSTVVGVMAYNKRRNIDHICIHRNWHILFTENKRCTKKAINEGRRYWVKKETSQDATLSGFKFSLSGLSFIKLEPYVLNAGEYITVSESKPAFLGYVLGDGWSQPQDQFVWSTGRRSEIDIGVEHLRTSHVYLDLGAFIPFPDFKQDIDVLVDGKSVGRASFGAADNRKVISFQVPPTHTESSVIEILLSNPISPLEAGISSDPRKLGIALYGIGKDVID
jgi:hypothetical protein